MIYVIFFLIFLVCAATLYEVYRVDKNTRTLFEANSFLAQSITDMALIQRAVMETMGEEQMVKANTRYEELSKEFQSNS